MLEAAKRRGKRTGLVVKSTVTNASPAAFSAHSDDRQKEQFIAKQQIAQQFDVILG
jgi:alkaline phosphatase